MQETTCAIWRTEATMQTVAGYIEMRRYNSPRAGGAYQVESLFSDNLKYLEPSQRLKLTTWLVDQRRLGTEAPVIDRQVIENCTRSRPLSVSQRRDRLLQYIHLQCPKISDACKLRPNDVFRIRSNGETIIQSQSHEALAWTESDSWNELNGLIDFSREFIIQSATLNDKSVGLSFAGFERLEAFNQIPTSSSQAFVAMWFNESMAVAFERGIAEGIRDAGYEPLRIDRKEHNNKIDDEIIAEIRRSRFVVADFTCPLTELDGKAEPIARGGVYYEAGFAQGLQLPVIWTCRKDILGHVHFDTRQYAHIEWENPEELRDKLSKRISATLGDGPGKR